MTTDLKNMYEDLIKEMIIDGIKKNMLSAPIDKQRAMVNMG